MNMVNKLKTHSNPSCIYFTAVLFGAKFTFITHLVVAPNSEEIWKGD